MTELAYGSAPAARDGAPGRDRYGLLINGAWAAAADGRTFDLDDPATGLRAATLAAAGPPDVERAVRAARRAQEKSWRKLRPAERAKHLFAFATALAERAPAVARGETLAAGTPIRVAGDGAAAAADAAAYFAGWADKVSFATRPGERARPFGVVAFTSDRSRGAHALGSRIAAALAAGNAAVVAAEPGDALALFAIAEAALHAELPAGLLGILTGPDAAAALLEAPDVAGVSFAGSAPGAVALRRALAGAGRPALLAARVESVPLLAVFADAPLDQAVDAAIASLAAGTGTDRSVGARCLVQEGLLETFEAGVRARLTFLRHGDPCDVNADVGPLADRAMRERAESYVREAAAAGACIDVAPWPAPEAGCGVPAAIVAGPAAAPRPDALRAPILTVASFRTPEEAVALAARLPRPSVASLWAWDDALLRSVARAVGATATWCRAFGPPGVLGDDGATMLREALDL